MALNAGLPVLPVVISPYYFLDHETRSFLPGKVGVSKNTGYIRNLMS